jgi:hypothetical protein
MLESEIISKAAEQIAQPLRFSRPYALVCLNFLWERPWHQGR